MKLTQTEITDLNILGVSLLIGTAVSAALLTSLFYFPQALSLAIIVAG